MEITIIHGQAHKGSTYHITSMIRDKLATSDSVIHEFSLPGDTPDFCVGCFQCICKGEEFCPQSEKVQRIVDSMLRSDVIVIDSPTYCYEMSGQLKTFIDHLGYMWMVHRPRKEMFTKIGIVISTTAGAGANNVTKSIARQLFWWGVPVVYRMGIAVKASGWKEVSEKLKREIETKTDALCRKVAVRIKKVRPGIKTKLYFSIMRRMNRSNAWNKIDRDYWEKNGWLSSSRPWR